MFIKKTSPNKVVIAENKTRNYKIKVYGTEYVTGQIAKTFLQLLDEHNQPVENASCWLDVYYPNTTVFIDYAWMLKFKDGLYYYDYVLPNVTGVYMIVVKCYVPTEEYHLKASEATIVQGTNYLNDYQATWFDDLVYWETRREGGKIILDFNFTVDFAITNETNIDVLTIYSMSWCFECLKMYIYDYSTNSWELLPNRGSGRWPQRIILSNPITVEKIDDYLSPDNKLTIRLETTAYRLDVDYLIIRLIGGTIEYQDLTILRGSGEAHVSEPITGVNLTAEVEWPPQVRTVS